MKRENFEEAKRLVTRIEEMEEALKFYNSTKENEFFWSRLFPTLYKNGRKSEFELGYKHDFTISISMEQQEELANLVRKWVEEDKKKLETL